MEMGRCGTCRHWSFASPDWEFDEIELGECKAIKMRGHLEEEVEAATGIERYDDGWDEAMKSALRATKALAVDGSGYYAGVRCSADFGCVLHEAIAMEARRAETPSGSVHDSAAIAQTKSED